MQELTETQKKIKDFRKQQEKQKQIDDELKNKRDIKIGIAIVSTIIVPAFLFVVIYGLFFYENRHKPKAPKKDQDTIWIEEQFSAWNGEHLQLGKIAKSSLTFPETYEHINSVYFKDDNKKEIIVKTTFSGKNAFGVKQSSCIMAAYSFTGTEIKPPSSC